MAKSKKTKVVDKKTVDASQPMQGQDSFRNFAAGIGYGTNNISSQGTYGYNPITLVRPLLEWMHRGQGLCGTIIDCVADDMTRAGVDIKGEMKPEDIDAVNEMAVSLGVWNSLNECIKWSRLYGGSVAVILIDGQDLSTPLRIETVGEGQFKGLMVLDRWQITVNLSELVKEYGPYFGQPKYYDVLPTSPGLIGMKIHYSRVIRMEGIRLPWWQRITLSLWGESILERVWDLLLNYNSSTQGIAQLMYRLHLRTYAIKDLKTDIATGASGTGGFALQGLMAQIAFMRQTQSNEGITLIDSEDKFEVHQNASISGASDVLIHFAEQISGAVQIPLVRLMGQSPAGLNATGESDLRTYYDEIARQQKTVLTVGCTLVYRAMVQSLGMEWPEGTTLGFRPLWQLSAVEKADVASKLTASIVSLHEAAIISPKTALMDLKQMSPETGFMSNITDKDIADAEDVPAPAPEPIEVAEIKEEGNESQATDEAMVCPICNGLGRLAVKYSDRTPDGTTRAVLEAVDCSNCRGTGKIQTAKDSVERVRAYAMRHGLDIAVENEEGSIRKGRGWHAVMPADYGYIIGSKGADGDMLDCYVGPNIESDKVFVIDQANLETGEFDEHKCILGVNSYTEAMKIFNDGYSDGKGPQRFIAMTMMSMKEFKHWSSGDLSKPLWRAD